MSYNEATRLENRWGGNFVKKITPAREQNAAPKIELFILGVEEFDEAGVVPLAGLQLVDNPAHVGIAGGGTLLGSEVLYHDQVNADVEVPAVPGVVHAMDREDIRTLDQETRDIRKLDGKRFIAAPIP